MSIYCVYVTVYRGNKLPPFYIGSVRLSQISKGYRTVQPFQGFHHSEETKKRMGEAIGKALKGRKLSLDHKLKLKKIYERPETKEFIKIIGSRGGKGNKNKPKSFKHKRNISQALSGKPGKSRTWSVGSRKGIKMPYSWSRKKKLEDQPWI